MTVIKGNKTYNYPKPGSAIASDTESLNLGSVSASDTESVNNEPYINNANRLAQRSRGVKPSQIEELINVKKSSGKRKMRRYHNRCILQTLCEEEEDNDFVIIMECYKSPFARLLEDDSAMQYWNEFIEKSEEEQTLIVHAFSEKYNNNYCDDKYGAQENNRLPGRVSSKIKHTFKIKKNLSLEAVKDCEDNLLNFFKDSPDAVVVKCPPTSFDRLLLHAIAQYHGLRSTNVLADDGGKRFVEIHKGKDNWNPADCFLTDFIQQLRR